MLCAYEEQSKKYNFLICKHLTGQQRPEHCNGWRAIREEVMNKTRSTVQREGRDDQPGKATVPGQDSNLFLATTNLLLHCFPFWSDRGHLSCHGVATVCQS
jgi:hypothetical protein